MDVRLPDGTIIQGVPDGTTKADLAAKLQSNGMAVPADWLAAEPPPKQAAVKAGETIRGVPRQVGLTARYGLEGPAQALSMFTEPIRQYITDPLVRAVTGRQGSSPSLSTMATKAADTIGLPAPQDANERVVGDATRLLAGGGTLGLGGRAAAQLPGMVGQAGQFFAAKPVQQAMSAAGAGLAGGAVRESGGGPWEQFAASLLAGVGVPTAGNAVASIANNLKSRLTPTMTAQQVEQQIELTLRGQGVDWSQVPERVRQAMRQEASAALRTGGALNPDATRRLLDFERVGATPTRGMLTQDPVQITREMNLAKTGANSTDISLQRLPGLQNQNTQTLLNVLDQQGARNAPDAFATGQRVIGALQGNVAQSRARIDSLYGAARDTQGRSAPLDGAAFTQRANQELDAALVGGSLPESVAGHLNRIAKGEVPFTVDYAEQLKTAIGNLQRASNDGKERMALGMVRRALDATPLRPAAQVNPGNLPAVPGTVPTSPAVMGAESVQAFNRARSANRAFMQRVEETPALQAVVDGVEPDRFVQQFITGQGATVRDVQALRRAVSNSPEALSAVQANIAAHLKSAATNGTEDVTKFSPVAYNRALNNIGDRKLSAFFEPEQIAQLRAVGRVGTLMTSQPAGAAVNNSNSGALLLGRGLDILDRIAGRLPLGGDTLIQGTLRGIQQGQALNVPRSILASQPRLTGMERLGVPAIYGGLLATQPVD
jgi:hypothetical protein